MYNPAAKVLFVVYHAAEVVVMVVMAAEASSRRNIARLEFALRMGRFLYAPLTSVLVEKPHAHSAAANGCLLWHNLVKSRKSY